MIDWGVVGPWIVAAIGVGSAWLTARIQHKGRPENAIIDQLQENQAASDRRIAVLESRIVGFEARDQVYIPHILRLNYHIEQGLGPPAPKIPKVIEQYLAQQGED